MKIAIIFLALFVILTACTNQNGNKEDSKDLTEYSSSSNTYDSNESISTPQKPNTIGNLYPVDFSFSYLSKEGLEINKNYTFVLPLSLAFIENSVGGTINHANHKIVEISISDRERSENWINNITSKERILIGEYNYYYDSYETSLVDEDDIFSNYIIHEYRFYNDSLWYLFRYFENTDTTLISKLEFEEILKSFEIKHSH